YLSTSAIFVVRNDGPQDLDSVVVHRPRPADGITYGIAVTSATDFQDQADLGQLAMAQEARFTLSYGSTPKLPEFRVRIVCRLGDEEWHLTQLLEEGREDSPPMVFSARPQTLSHAKLRRGPRGAQNDENRHDVVPEDHRSNDD